MTIVQQMMQDLERRKAELQEEIRPQLDEISEIEGALEGLRGRAGRATAAPRRRAGKTNRDRVLEVLRASDEPLKGTEIADRAGISSKTAVYPVLRQLTADGEVLREGDSYRPAWAAGGMSA